MTLGELIAFLEKRDPEQKVPLGFGNPHSYRGYYDELAFEIQADTTVGEMLEAAREALGTTYTGWKGGDFTMGEYTPVWLAEEGTMNPGETIGELLLRSMLGEDLTREEGETETSWTDPLTQEVGMKFSGEPDQWGDHQLMVTTRDAKQTIWVTLKSSEATRQLIQTLYEGASEGLSVEDPKGFSEDLVEALQGLFKKHLRGANLCPSGSSGVITCSYCGGEG